MLRVVLSVALILASAPVLASSFAGTSAGSASNASSDGSSASSNSSSGGDEKVVLAAREEAAGFIASAGEVRGVRLQAALLHLRETDPANAAASDLELARSILAR